MWEVGGGDGAVNMTDMIAGGLGAHFSCTYFFSQNNLCTCCQQKIALRTDDQQQITAAR